MASQNPGRTEDDRLEHLDNPELGSCARDIGATLPNPAEGTVSSGP
jgi:hypothetical protein